MSTEPLAADFAEATDALLAAAEMLRDVVVAKTAELDAALEAAQTAAAETQAALDEVRPPNLDFSRPVMAGSAVFLLLGA